MKGTSHGGLISYWKDIGFYPKSVGDYSRVFSSEMGVEKAEGCSRNWREKLRLEPGRHANREPSVSQQAVVLVPASDSCLLWGLVASPAQSSV